MTQISIDTVAHHKIAIDIEYHARMSYLGSNPRLRSYSRPKWNTGPNLAMSMITIAMSTRGAIMHTLARRARSDPSIPGDANALNWYASIGLEVINPTMAIEPHFSRATSCGP